MLENEEVTGKEKNINEYFPDEHLMVIRERPWFAGMANYIATKSVLKDYNWQQEKHFYKRLTNIFGMSLICLRLVMTI